LSARRSPGRGQHRVGNAVRTGLRTGEQDVLQPEPVAQADQRRDLAEVAAEVVVGVVGALHARVPVVEAGDGRSPEDAERELRAAAEAGRVLRVVRRADRRRARRPGRAGVGRRARPRPVAAGDRGVWTSTSQPPGKAGSSSRSPYQAAGRSGQTGLMRRRPGRPRRRRARKGLPLHRPYDRRGPPRDAAPPAPSAGSARRTRVR